MCGFNLPCPIDLPKIRVGLEISSLTKRAEGTGAPKATAREPSLSSLLVQSFHLSRCSFAINVPRHFTENDHQQLVGIALHICELLIQDATARGLLQV